MNKDRSKLSVGHRNDLALKDAIEKAVGEVSRLNAKVGAMERRQAQMQQDIDGLRALLQTGMFATSTGRTVSDDQR